MLQLKTGRQKALAAILACTVLFQLFYIFFILFHYNEIYFNPSVKPLTYEYWTWLGEHPEAINDKLADAVLVIYYRMNVICLLGFLCLLTPEEDSKSIKLGQLLAAFLFGYGIYKICTLAIRYFSPDYRLYMLLIPTEIASLILMFLILKVLNDGNRRLQSG